MFISLHNHSDHSLRVGFQTVEQLGDFLRHSSVERRVYMTEEDEIAETLERR